MTEPRVTRRVYSAEQLQRLRASYSQPKLREAIEQLDGDDAELVKASRSPSNLSSLQSTCIPISSYDIFHSQQFLPSNMNTALSPTFDNHRKWIEDLITTPDTPFEKRNSSLLTLHESPTEHVLRGSKSWAARSYRSRASGHSLRVPSNKENQSTNDADNSRRSSSSLHAPITGPSVPVLGEIAPNGQILRPTGAFKFRPSPTPSLKKKKAEAIVKAHGSPQHVRVTAGGRIVPSEQSPLCHPRYGYSAIKTNGGLIKFAPNHPMGKAQWTQATQNGFVAQDVNGRLCQIVNGTILPLNEVDGALRLYVPAPNLNISSRGSSFGPPAPGSINATGPQQRAASLSNPSLPPDPPIPAQTNALELEYSKLEHELKELGKTEALHGRTMAKTAKDALVSKRRELVTTLDNIRKAIKSIKGAPQVEMPHSPPQARGEQLSISPPRNRLPAFLQQRADPGNDGIMPHFSPNFNQFFGINQTQQQSGQWGSQTTPSPDAPFHNPYAMPPLFVPPPPFDGSTAASYGGFANPAAFTSHPLAVDNNADATANDTQLPQNDGTNSIKGVHKVSSPRQSRAVDIKAPPPHPATSLKSNLNPMSPAYKPGTGVLKSSGDVSGRAPQSVKDRVPTPLSPMHQLRPSTTAQNTGRTSDGTISPKKKSPHLQSSSVSSFETADFFPRNPREYSTRKHAYPDASEEKENMAPKQCADGTLSSSATPPTDFEMQAAIRALPPTALTLAGSSTAKVTNDLPFQRSSTSQHAGRIFSDSLPDRNVNNMSPKSKRQDFLFVEEHPSQYTDTSSSPERQHRCREELCATASPTEQIDFSEASRDWIEGYRAGLARKPVGSDRQGEFLDGYCAGLLKSKPVDHARSDGSPVKSAARRLSPGSIASRSSSRLRLDHHDKTVIRPSLETSLQSMNTLKEAVLAPQNENAILTPLADGPHADDAHFNLGAWAKHREPMASAHRQPNNIGTSDAGFPFPNRTSSMLERQGFNISGDQSRNQHDSQASMPSVATDMAIHNTPIASNANSEGLNSWACPTSGLKNATQANSFPASNRVSSITSIDSTMYRQWPGYRVFSPQLEWKSASSVAQAAGLASGNFAGRDSEGARPTNNVFELADLQYTDTFHTAQQQRVTSMTSNPPKEYHGRFKEGSLDGITNPPNSPLPTSPPMSPTMSPKHTPGKDSPKRTSSPSKGPSPAKAKFEHIAEKVGIKVSTAIKKDEEHSPCTPPGKRNWRNVWRGGSKKDSSKDDGVMQSIN